MLSQVIRKINTLLLLPAVYPESKFFHTPDTMQQIKGFKKLLFMFMLMAIFIPCVFIFTSTPYALHHHNFMFEMDDDEKAALETSESVQSKMQSIVSDPESIDCTEILARFRADDIEIAKNKEDRDYRRSYVAVNVDTDKPFYVSTHDPKIDGIRAQIMQQRKYYEFELTQRVVEIFEEKTAKREECIMLDVGANIGWFSLVAAAHGASKVYSFEPNLQNTVRFCESLSLNRWLHDDRSQDFVMPIAKGVGKKEETKTLYATSKILDNPGSFTFQERYAYRIETTDENNNVVRVPSVIGEMQITTLDLFAERHKWFETQPCIALFKLDVEHFEFEVLQGAKKLLKSNLIEVIAMELKTSYPKSVKSDIIKLLYTSGYEMYKHGRWMGPNKNVEQVYDNWQDLLEDIHNAKYGENTMFRLRTKRS